MNLIDKDALLDGLIKDDPRHVLVYINQFPTVDPVQHEHWEMVKLTDPISGQPKMFVMCSGCKHTQKTASAFCGGCGARMDGGVNG